MARTNWKRSNPISLRHAMELCVQYAKERKNLSVEQISDLMGEASHFTLYKWIESGRMPAIKIRPFEHACGADFVTRYLAHSGNKLLIDMPTGRRPEHRELNELSVAAHQTIAMLIEFYDDQQSADDTISAITLLMEGLAHQKGNVEQHQQPALELSN